MTEDLTIYTIGHSNAPDSVLVALLKQYEIEVLVDVRSSPYSQYASQYNRENVELILREAEIEYRYAGDYLGGRPKDPSCYQTEELPDAGADYLRQVDYPTVMTKGFFQKGISRLLELARESRIAVMCSEEDPARCHRHHLIGRYLVEQGVAVLHIRGDGACVPDQALPNLPAEPPSTQLKLF